MPSDAIQILVHRGGRPLRRRDGLGESSVVIAGPTTRTFEIDRADQDALIGIVLRPGGLRALGGCPESVVDVAVPGFANLASAGGDVSGIERALHPRLRRLPPPWLAEAVRCLERGEQVGPTADRLGQAHRSFRRRFRRHTGLGPKVFARIARMKRCLPLLADHDATEVAYLAGFADQAHFTAEFRALTGVTPGRYRPRTGWQLHLAESHNSTRG